MATTLGSLLLLALALWLLLPQQQPSPVPDRAVRSSGEVVLTH